MPKRTFRILLFIFFLILGVFSWSQEKEQDSLLFKANKLYTQGSYYKAALTYNKLYLLDTSNTGYLYYASVSAVSAKDYKLALKYYLKLESIGYTGIEKEYYATNKKTKAVEVLPKDVRDSLVKVGLYRKPRSRKTKSKKPEITKNIVLIYVKLENYESAKTFISKAIKDNPKNTELKLTEANIYYSLGDKEQYKILLEKIAKKERKNVDVLYNLGVLSAQNKENKQATKYYKKVIKINPNYVNAYINLSALILNKEVGVVNQMNGLGNTKADNLKYNALVKTKKRIYKNALPYLRKVIAIDNTQLDAINTLYNVYLALNKIEIANTLKLKFGL